MTYSLENKTIGSNNRNSKLTEAGAVHHLTAQMEARLRKGKQCH